jgi:hypothetical protein
LPATSDTRLVAAVTPGAVAACAAMAAGSFAAASAAALPNNDVFRKLLRVLWHSDFIGHTSWDFGGSIRLDGTIRAAFSLTGVIQIT